MKSLENKAYNTEEVTLIKTSFTENWPRQKASSFMISYITANTLSTTLQVFKLSSVCYIKGN